MSFNISRGNIDQHLNGPNDPHSVGEVITPAGYNKFTVHGAPAGSTLGPIAMNLAFAHQYGINQVQKGGGAGGVDFSFCDASGNVIGTPNHDQGMCMVRHQDVGDRALYFQATFHKAGDYTFTGGAG